MNSAFRVRWCSRSGAAKPISVATSCRITRCACSRRKAISAAARIFFRQEFLAALKMVEDGLAKPAEMKSSWGGAMGLTQFLPSEFYKHAVDFDGDGRADIFNSVPDALASAAKQLAAKGWERGERWAYEVRAPSQFDCTQGVPEVVKPIREWLRLGFVPSYDRKLTAAETSRDASVLQPEGALGPAFLTPKNYFVLKDYNFSDLYVLFVGQLATGSRAGAASSSLGARAASCARRKSRRCRRSSQRAGSTGTSSTSKAGMQNARGARRLSEGGRLAASIAGRAVRCSTTMRGKAVRN
jgi:hypothetical protein